MNGTVEKVQEGAPLFEDRGLVLLLSQLIVDVLILDGLGVILVADAADVISRSLFIDSTSLLWTNGRLGQYACGRFGG